MVGLHAADGDQGVGVRLDGVGHDVFELTHLVTAEGETRIAVLALGVDLDPATQMRRETVQFLDGRRAESQGIAFEFFQHGGDS